jgi:uncharacterized protein (TIGR00730 family)
MHITVFGGANPKPGEPPYDQALKLGRLLGSAGHTVLTGGYGGTMEAVSRGAAEAGAHVIGVTCGEIETYRFARPNPWVKEIRHFESLVDRLTEMMNNCQAAIALPGGAGTLTEITLLWNRVIIKSVPSLALILVGTGWKTVFNQFLLSQEDYISAPDGSLLSFAATVEEAAEMVTRITTSYGAPQKHSA